MNKSPKVFHPLLFAIFPAVFLYSHNIGEVFLSQMLVPLGVCLAGGILLWCMFFALLKNKLKSAILTSLMFIFFFSYGHFLSLIKGLIFQLPIWGIHTYILPVWTLTIVISVVLAFRTKRNLCNITKILNVITVCLIAMTGSTIAVFHFKTIVQARSIVLSRQPDDNSKVDGAKLENMPNIYYIILDGYARADILEEEFGYDNSAFISYLKNNGFFVGENSRSNYMKTLLSIPSSTNFKYLDDLAETYGSDSKNTKPMVRLTVNNRLFGFLKQIGYSTVSFSAGCGFSALKNADYYFSDGFTDNSFVNELLNGTPLIALQKYSRKRYSTHYKTLKYTFDKLPDTAKIPSPHVVFVHILCPHSPYVFDENGRFTGQSGPFRLDKLRLEIDEQKAKYLAQLKYVNKRITQAVDGIIANSRQKPIIVLQADHGIRWPLDDKPGSSSSKDCQFAILNALHLPGFDYSKLDNNITPVNTFRFVFNHYFGTEFEILENKNFRSGRPYYYKFKDVTESLNER